LTLASIYVIIKLVLDIFIIYNNKKKTTAH